MLDPCAVREDFPILKRRINGHPLVYFDNAATSHKPRQVIDVIKDFYQKNNANVHRAAHTLSQEATELFEEARRVVADFIRARSIEETVFVKGTTEGINLVAYSYGLHNLTPQDEVLVSLMEHHSNIVPWEIVSKIRGFKVKFFDVNNDGSINQESLERSISRKTKVVCISHVSNVTGGINDVKQVAKIAHEKSAIVLVDGAQSVPHLPVNVADLDVDFLTFSGHKMLGPTGVGVLYGRADLLKKMEPFEGGGEMIREVVYDPKIKNCTITWNDLPWKFEAGTQHVSGAIGLAEAMRYLSRLGMESVKGHEVDLTRYALKEISGMNNRVTTYGPRDAETRCGIIPFTVKGLSSHDVSLFLDNFGIMVRSGYHCAQPLHTVLGLSSTARASFYVYNTKEEIDRFCEILKETASF